MEKKFKRDINSLDKIFGIINSFINTEGIDDAIAITMNLVVEELFTNMLKYHCGLVN